MPVCKFISLLPDTMMNNGWIGVGLDGTLAQFDGWIGPEHIGAPVPRMLERVKDWLDQGLDVRIFTDRVHACPSDARRTYDASVARQAIQIWCDLHVGRRLPVTCMTDCGMVELWDTRCIPVEENTGRRLDEQR